MRPTVSVIIPTYNYAYFLHSTLRSLARQSYRNLQVIIIDDGSTDNTCELIENFKLFPIEYAKQNNSGLPASRNRGLSMATGKYIQFLDADDMLSVHSISARVEHLEKHNDAIATYCSARYFRTISRTFIPVGSWPPPVKLPDMLYYRNIAPAHSFLIRHSIIKDLQLRFDENLKACEDYDFWYKISLRSGKSFEFCPNGYAYYRRHCNSMSKQKLNQVRHDAILSNRILSDMESGRFIPGTNISDSTVLMLSNALGIYRQLLNLNHALANDYKVGTILNRLLPLFQYISFHTPPQSYVWPYAIGALSLTHRLSLTPGSEDILSVRDAIASKLGLYNIKDLLSKIPTQTRARDVKSVLISTLRYLAGPIRN